MKLSADEWSKTVNARFQKVQQGLNQAPSERKWWIALLRDISELIACVGSTAWVSNISLVSFPSMFQLEFRTIMFDQRSEKSSWESIVIHRRKDGTNAEDMAHSVGEWPGVFWRVECTDFIGSMSILENVSRKTWWIFIESWWKHVKTVHWGDEFQQTRWSKDRCQLPKKRHGQCCDVGGWRLDSFAGIDFL